MAKTIDKQTMLNLIIEAKRTDPETGGFAEWLAEYLAEHLPTLTPPNEPLSTEQLREMDGEPVWIVNPDALGYGRWGIVDGVYQAEDDQVLMLRGDYSCHYYGKTWLAYRRPPEGEEDIK